MASREESKRLAQYARNLAATRLLYRVSLVARVESEEDIPFWQHAFSHSRPDLKVKYLPGENGEGTDVRQRGKTVCMRYVPYLNRNFIICVDSDFDRFTRPGTLLADRFIFQTYTYSFENHHCWAESLQSKWQQLAVCDFDFKAFLARLSGILYPVLIEMLTTKAAKKKAWNLTELCGVILSAQVNRAGVLDNNGHLLLEEIKSKVEDWSSRQVHPTAAACEKMRNESTDLGLIAETAYLFMQGHCIFDLVQRIGRILCDGRHDFRYEVLMQTLASCTSPEMNHILADIKNL
ncbi:MAG: DUF4435 domain-containing protein [Alloprevotella sp.]|nr:DUF4435 domain-containing protein [Alloprevotella sp.]